MLGRVLIFSVLVAFIQAKAVITNNCRNDVYVWSVPFQPGLADNLAVGSGKRYEEPWHHGTAVNPGVAIKVSTEHNGIYNGKSEIDFQYTVDPSDHTLIWFDLSIVRGNSFDNFTLNSCHGSFETSEVSTQLCSYTDDIELVFCGTERTVPAQDITPPYAISSCIGEREDAHNCGGRVVGPRPGRGDSSTTREDSSTTQEDSSVGVGCLMVHEIYPRAKCIENIEEFNWKLGYLLGECSEAPEDDEDDEDDKKPRYPVRQIETKLPGETCRMIETLWGRSLNSWPAIPVLRAGPLCRYLQTHSVRPPWIACDEAIARSRMKYWVREQCKNEATENYFENCGEALRKIQEILVQYSVHDLLLNATSSMHETSTINATLLSDISADSHHFDAQKRDLGKPRWVMQDAGLDEYRIHKASADVDARRVCLLSVDEKLGKYWGPDNSENIVRRIWPQVNWTYNYYDCTPEAIKKSRDFHQKFIDKKTSKEILCVRGYSPSEENIKKVKKELGKVSKDIGKRVDWTNDDKYCGPRTEAPEHITDREALRQWAKEHEVTVIGQQLEGSLPKNLVPTNKYMPHTVCDWAAVSALVDHWGNDKDKIRNSLNSAFDNDELKRRFDNNAGICDPAVVRDTMSFYRKNMYTPANHKRCLKPLCGYQPGGFDGMTWYGNCKDVKKVIEKISKDVGLNLHWTRAEKVCKPFTTVCLRAWYTKNELSDPVIQAKLQNLQSTVEDKFGKNHLWFTVHNTICDRPDTVRLPSIRQDTLRLCSRLLCKTDMAMSNGTCEDMVAEVNSLLEDELGVEVQFTDDLYVCNKATYITDNEDAELKESESD